MEQQKIDLDALEAAPAKAETITFGEVVDRLHVILPALPALIAELRARVTPEPISEKHRDGQEWLVYWTEAKRWRKCYWANEGGWVMSGVVYLDFGTPTHALPLPPDPEAQ